MSIESRPSGAGARPRISSVEPAADVDHQHRPARRVRAGCGPRRRRPAPPPRRRTPPRARRRAARARRRRRRRRCAASRVAEVAQKRTPVGRRARAISVGVLVDRGERPRQRLVGAAARCGRRPGRAGPSASRGPATVGQVADQQLDRVGAAVDGGDAVSGRRLLDRRRRARAHQSPEQVEHLVAERVHAAALGQRLAGQHVQALHPVGHPAGGDALDLGHVEPELAAAGAAEVALVRGGGTPRPAPGRRPSRSCISFISPEPRGCRSARPRAGR